MSLTSYRAAPPRVKTIRKREARAPPAAAYLAIAIPIEKAAAPLSPAPHGLTYFCAERASRLAFKRGGGETLAADGVDEPADQLALGRQNLLPGLGGRKPLRTIDFGKGRLASALGWPFEFEAVGDQRCGIEVAFHPPRCHDLPTGLNHIAEGEEIALRAGAGLLLEFALRPCQRVFALQIFPFRDRPGAVVLLGPEWTARMHEQNFDVVAAPPEHQEAGAALGHGTFSLPLRESARVTAGCCARSSASLRAGPRRRPWHAMRARSALARVRDSA